MEALWLFVDIIKKLNRQKHRSKIWYTRTDAQNSSKTFILLFLLIWNKILIKWQCDKAKNNKHHKKKNSRRSNVSRQSAEAEEKINFFASLWLNLIVNWTGRRGKNHRNRFRWQGAWVQTDCRVDVRTFRGHESAVNKNFICVFDRAHHLNHNEFA